VSGAPREPGDAAIAVARQELRPHHSLLKASLLDKRGLAATPTKAGGREAAKRSRWAPQTPDYGSVFSWAVVFEMTVWVKGRLWMPHVSSL
jgi:hypothetical protein